MSLSENLVCWQLLVNWGAAYVESRHQHMPSRSTPELRTSRQSQKIWAEPALIKTTPPSLHVFTDLVCHLTARHQANWTAVCTILLTHLKWFEHLQEFLFKRIQTKKCSCLRSPVIGTADNKWTVDLGQHWCVSGCGCVSVELHCIDLGYWSHQHHDSNSSKF